MNEDLALSNFMSINNADWKQIGDIKASPLGGIKIYFKFRIKKVIIFLIK